MPERSVGRCLVVAALVALSLAVPPACAPRPAQDVPSACAAEPSTPEEPHALYRLALDARVEQVREQVYRDEMGSWRSLRGVRLYVKRNGPGGTTAAAVEQSLHCFLARRSRGAGGPALADDPLSPPEGAVVEVRVGEGSGDTFVVTLIANGAVAAEQVAKRALALVERRASSHAAPAP